MDPPNKTHYCPLSLVPTLVRACNSDCDKLIFSLSNDYSFDYLFLYCFFFSLGESLPLSSGSQITVKFTTVGPETAKGFHFVYQGLSLFLSCCWLFFM